MTRKYVFGPILSRRLGVSLGVDLVTAKTCPLDCIYCEARATTNLTCKRKEYVPVKEVIVELQEVLQQIDPPDYITFSGAGEPTLNSGIGEVITFIKTDFPEIKLCLLTNGLLLGDKNLCRELLPVDLVIPSLDASNEAEYHYINRPVPGSTLKQLVEDIAGFARIFTHRMALEIFIVPGVNDSPASIERFADLVKYIAPAAVQLNTLDRPGAIPGLTAAPPEKLAEFAAALQNICEVETVRPLTEKRQHSTSTKLEEELLEILRHRKLDMHQLAMVSGIPETELAPLLSRLTQRRLITMAEDGTYSTAG